MIRTQIIILVSVTMIACGGDDSGGENNINQNNNIVNPICGNGILEPGEVCDDGANNSDVAPNACRTDCREPHCGDGVVDSGEDCDAENLASNSCVGLGFTKGTLACGQDCQYDVSDCTTCGDGVAEGTDTSTVGYETCDGTDLRGQTCISIGQANGTLACTVSCGWNIEGCTGGGPICGNSIVEGHEVCDDGNQINGDGCSSDCLSDESCGNGILDLVMGEECDDASANSDTEPDACRTDCTEPVNHDSVVDPSIGEECDDNGLGWNDPNYEAFFAGLTCADYVPNSNIGQLTCNFESGTDNTFISWLTCYVCGDGSCAQDEYENAATCPQDCAWMNSCGNGTCDPYENNQNCSDDCPTAPTCNLNGVCESNENYPFCMDCAPYFP